MVAEMWTITGPLDEICAWKTIVMAIAEMSMNSRYLTNHEDQYSHIRIPISFSNSCSVLTNNRALSKMVENKFICLYDNCMIMTILSKDYVMRGNPVAGFTSLRVSLL